MKNSLCLAMILCLGGHRAKQRRPPALDNRHSFRFDRRPHRQQRRAGQERRVRRRFQGHYFRHGQVHARRSAARHLRCLGRPRPGCEPYEKKGVAVKASQTASLDIRLGDTTQLNTLGEDRLRITADMKGTIRLPVQRRAPWTASPISPASGGSPAHGGSGQARVSARGACDPKAATGSNCKDSPQAHCLPSGPLRNGPLWEFVQSKDFLVYISDDESPGFHQIYLDGRGHPADPNPAWYGHSIGHWDGDTLVVDRVGFDNRESGSIMESHPHSDKLHIVERYHRPDLGHLEIEITVDDPGVLAKPWTQKRVADLAHEEIFEFICTENNRDVEHLVGK